MWHTASRAFHFRTLKLGRLTTDRCRKTSRFRSVGCTPEWPPPWVRGVALSLRVFVRQAVAQGSVLRLLSAAFVEQGQGESEQGEDHRQAHFCFRPRGEIECGEES